MSPVKVLICSIIILAPIVLLHSDGQGLWGSTLTPKIEELGAKGEAGIVKRDTKGLSVQFVSDVVSIEPGKPFKVGLLIKHDPGYHTYWKNPGIVGLPTSLNLSVPVGFQVSEIQWPSPEQSMMAVYPCYGYERDVLLYKVLTPPADLKQNTIKITNESQWMCCAKTCHPGFKKFELELEVGKHRANPEVAVAFKKASEQLPKEMPQISASLLSKPDAKMIKVRIVPRKMEKPIHVFNSDGQTTPDLKYKLVKQEKNGWIYTAERSEHGPQSAISFPFVLQTSKGFFKLNAQ